MGLRGFIIISILLMLELYVWQGFKVITESWSGRWRNVLTISYIITSIFSIGMVVGVFIGGREFVSSRFVGLAFGFVMVFVMGKLFMSAFLIMDDLLRVMRWITVTVGIAEKHETGISRLKFLSIVGAFMGALPAASLSWGIIRGAHDYKVVKVPLKLKNLPQEFVGKSIVQISDIHAGSFWDREAVKRGVGLIVNLRPDMVFFTGDMVNNIAKEMKGYEEIFGEISAPLGVYSVLGNHDYGDYIAWNSIEDKMKNIQDLIDIQKGMGWDVLMNESRQIKIKDAVLNVVGIENYGAKGRFKKYGKMNEAMKGVRSDENILLLSHDPSHWKAQVLTEYNMVDAMFSGHTHGAQFGIETGGFKWSPVKYMYKEWAGMYRESDQQLYVNRGFGYIGYPGRFGIRPEITQFIMERA
jgi:predicted MPP superfamily phosphohydrolase